jgi:hypothetical protein
MQNLDSVTIHDSTFVDIYREAPNNNATNWDNEHDNRIQGIFVSGTDHLLLDGLFVDQVGWQDDYNAGIRAVEGGQPPSILSQNIYIQNTNDRRDPARHDQMRAASFGAQVRSGGLIEDNIFIDNNAA